ncbi:MAG: 5'-3' exonuclease [Solirubrobacteraceae bacterium]
MPAPLLIADVPWLLYRSFFGLPKSITDDQGRPVGALLGTVNALLAIIEGRPARGVVACVGAEQAAYRVALYPPYHAHRDPMPAELRWQWEQAPALLRSLGFVVCDAGDLEADDAMFSHARTEAEAGGEALLLTADRDLYQAVDEQVRVAQLEKGRFAGEIGPAQVRERYHGIGPELVSDFIALRGDPSDGLPGAPGIGAKTAAELLLEHGTLEQLLSVAQVLRSGLRPRLAATLRENDELLRTFKEIATLQRMQVKRPADRGTDFAGGAVAARELGMRRLAQRLAQAASA